MRILAGIFLLLVLGAVGAAHLIAVLSFEPRLRAVHLRIERVTPKILKDFETLRRNPPFEESAFEKDASSTLNQYVSWEGAAAVDGADKVRELFTRYTYWKTAPGQLKQMLEDPDFKKLDADWVNQLYKFDHWFLPGRPEWGEKLRGMGDLNGLDRVIVWSKLPLPNYNEIRQWATLNFLKKQKAGQGLAGLHAFRKAAELVHSSGTLVGNNVVAAMLQDEVFLMEHFHISGWEQVPDEVIEAYKRVSWAWSGLAREPWFGKFPEAFEPFLKPQFGACVVALEMNAGVPGFQDFLEPRFVFETNYSGHIQRVREFQHRVMSLCHLQAYHSAFGPTPPNANPLFKKEGGKDGNGFPLSGGFGGINYSRVPYLRRILGLILMTIAVPDYFRLYDKDASR